MTAEKIGRVLTLVISLLAVLVQPAHAAEMEFSQVTENCRLSFPVDHGPHPGYRTEWWYYTGNLSDTHNRRFGFQLTFFRVGLQPPGKRQSWPEPASSWRSDQIYLAHAALTDIDGKRHLQAERTARPVLSMAGADWTGDALTLHLHGWQAVIAPGRHQLKADTDDFGLALDLTPIKAAVLHGDGGYSRKGQAPERASCYYSFTRLEAAGSLTVGDSRHQVQGSAWMDHEFSTAPLQPGLTGWDWFSLQLSDQTEVMVYLLRDKGGGPNPASSGTLVLAAGQTRHLQSGDITLKPVSFWTSPHTGARYPVRWQLSIASRQLDLEVAANFADQEMRTPRSTNVVYWEGSVSAAGTQGDKSVRGVGYVELTGYAQPFDAPL